MGPTDFEFALRVLLATGCGLIIGLERQFRSRTAGLRTQALVAAGAAVFVLFGEQAALPQAPLQIAAYVVSGVGFLGGGVILRQGFTVQGLNTAATLWCSAAVGCQAAAGHLLPALWPSSARTDDDRCCGRYPSPPPSAGAPCRSHTRNERRNDWSIYPSGSRPPETGAPVARTIGAGALRPAVCTAPSNQRRGRNAVAWRGNGGTESRNFDRGECACPAG